MPLVAAAELAVATTLVAVAVTDFTASVVDIVLSRQRVVELCRIQRLEGWSTLVAGRLESTSLG